jgi:hypothetical protein
MATEYAAAREKLEQVGAHRTFDEARQVVFEVVPRRAC